jgi:AcrR family transcriptional regulator
LSKEEDMAVNRKLNLSHKQATKDHLLNCAMALLSEGQDKDLTFQGIAQKSEISERTVYRHLKSQEALCQDLLPLVTLKLKNIQVPEASGSFPEYISALYETCEANSGLVKSLVTTGFGRNILNGEKLLRYQKILKLLKKEFPKRDSQLLRISAANLRYVGSGVAWEFYRFQAQLPLDLAIRAGTSVVINVLTALKQD